LMEQAPGRSVQRQPSFRRDRATESPGPARQRLADDVLAELTLARLLRAQTPGGQLEDQ